MSDEIDVLKLVGRRLDSAGMRYMVSGSMALNCYAQPRMTRDIDIVVEIRAADAERMAALFAADFYCDVDMIRDAVQHNGMFNLIHNESIVKVDFITRKPSAYRQTEFDRRRVVVVEGQSLSIVAAEDLLLSKLVWAKDGQSAQQLDDARNLVDNVPDLDLHRHVGSRAWRRGCGGRSAPMKDTPTAFQERYRRLNHAALRR